MLKPETSDAIKSSVQVDLSSNEVPEKLTNSTQDHAMDTKNEQGPMPSTEAAIGITLVQILSSESNQEETLPDVCEHGLSVDHWNDDDLLL